MKKINILDYAIQHPTMGCRKLAEHFSIGKTAVSNILKDSKNLRRDHEFFKGSYKKRRHGKYHLINEILYTWYGKCASATIYVDGSLLREVAMEIKEKLNKEELNDFNATNGWLESWEKKHMAIREMRLCGRG